MLFSLSIAAPGAQSKQHGINFSFDFQQPEEIKGIGRQPAGFKFNSNAIT
jgi:hypothetical protein